MKTKIMPAGNFFDYVKGQRDSLGRPREFPPRHFRGDEAIATRLLLELAPRGVRPPRCPGRDPQRPASEWVRHNQRHHFHLISCFHEARPHVEGFLSRITEATEELILLGLPGHALHFTWYEHPKTHGAHPHGSLPGILLTDGRPYAPDLDPELLLCFDRLVSAKCGFADPLDPRGCRPIFASWASAKPVNAADIQTICSSVGRRWAEPSGVMLTHPDLLRHLERDLKFPVLVAPDRHGQPVRTPVPAPPQLRVPRYRQTVVVASHDGQRVIGLQGPICHHDFNPAAFRAAVAQRDQLVTDLRRDAEPVYRRFLALAQQRLERQRTFWDGPDAQRVGLRDFGWLRPPWDWEWGGDILINPADDNLELLDPLDRWTERDFPFACAGWPEPIEDPQVYVEAELERLEEEIPVEELTTPSAPPIISIPLAPPTPSVATGESSPPAPPATPVAPPAPVPVSFDLEAERVRRQRRRLALATSLAIAQRHEMAGALDAPKTPDLN